MHVITTYSPKGGSGRTTVVLSLASGFLAQGKRVVIMDCGEGPTLHPAKLSFLNPPRYPTSLQKWADARAQTDTKPQVLKHMTCETYSEVEDGIGNAQAHGFDIMLVDTKRVVDDPQAAAHNNADLILAPAISCVEAGYIRSRIESDEVLIEPLYGVITGGHHGPQQAFETRQAFGDIPVFRSELPYAESIGNQLLGASIADLGGHQPCQPDDPGYGGFLRAQEAWVAVQGLTYEVEWALRGFELGPVESDRRYMIKSIPAKIEAAHA